MDLLPSECRNRGKQGGNIQNSSIYTYVLPCSEIIQPVISHTDTILSLLQTMRNNVLKDRLWWVNTMARPGGIKRTALSSSLISWKHA